MSVIAAAAADALCVWVIFSLPGSYPEPGMNESTTRFGVAHPTVVPVNHPHDGDDDTQREAAEGGDPA